MTELTNKKAEEFMNLPGEARGIHLKNDAQYVQKTKGEKGLKKVEKEWENVGIPLEYEDIENLKFYPAGYRPLSLLAVKKAFSWGEEDIKKMCEFSAGASLIVRLYLKFFYSLDKIAEKAPEVYKEYFSSGELEVAEYDKEKRYALIRIKGCDLVEEYCRCLEGYLKGFITMAIREKAACREVKCTFQGDPYHEFLIEWGNE